MTIRRWNNITRIRINRRIATKRKRREIIEKETEKKAAGDTR